MSSSPFADHLAPVPPVTSELLRRRARAAACEGHRRVDAPTAGSTDGPIELPAADPPRPGGAR